MYPVWSIINPAHNLKSLTDSEESQQPWWALVLRMGGLESLLWAANYTTVQHCPLEETPQNCISLTFYLPSFQWLDKLHSYQCHAKRSFTCRHPPASFRILNYHCFSPFPYTSLQQRPLLISPSGVYWLYLWPQLAFPHSGADLPRSFPGCRQLWPEDSRGNRRSEVNLSLINSIPVPVTMGHTVWTMR